MILVGGSHATAIRQAARSMGVDLNFHVFHRNSPLWPSGKELFQPEFLAEFNGLEGTIFSSLGGNSHNVMGLIEHRAPFDFVHPRIKTKAKTDDDRTWVPFSAVKQSIEQTAGTFLRLLQGFAERYPGRVVHLQSPPQIEDETFIRQGIVDKGTDARKTGLAKFGIAPAALRYKLWRLNSEIFEERCAELGVKFVPVPSASITRSGFLKRKYWGDPTHANAAYGKLVLEQMRQHA
ncbi:hypothetical protein [Kumtagia ephedrae]|jgi:hypothetical protein|uniref:SGNH/GDSL hydrolase family protein n=1 Tax=Kumtagia ephedrae TaxID=2116701 RepID=A0A2P7SJB9_9HYPH|nr:hypothetical protein [Mesorhizobium ephedrae]PSJ62573.1 hypothetical protein C7I84_08180 [Mesorhizobium ephedrae]